MEIVDERPKAVPAKALTVAELKPGDVFEFVDKKFTPGPMLRADRAGCEETVYAISLADGNIGTMLKHHESAEVRRLDTRLVIAGEAKAAAKPSMAAGLADAIAGVVRVLGIGTWTDSGGRVMGIPVEDLLPEVKARGLKMEFNLYRSTWTITKA